MVTRSKKRLEEDIRRVATSPGGFTVQIRNEMLGSARCVGSFETEGQAATFADREASRSRNFVHFEIWTGSPRDPRMFVRDAGRGRA